MARREYTDIEILAALNDGKWDGIGRTTKSRWLREADEHAQESGKPDYEPSGRIAKALAAHTALAVELVDRSDVGTPHARARAREKLERETLRDFLYGALMQFVDFEVSEYATMNPAARMKIFRTVSGELDRIEPRQPDGPASATPATGMQIVLNQLQQNQVNVAAAATDDNAILPPLTAPS